MRLLRSLQPFSMTSITTFLDKAEKENLKIFKILKSLKEVMRNFFLSLFFLQIEPPLPKGGLPYWIFWFLLCVILLLLTFIFLRDKRLRMRLNSFFTRARRKVVKIRLQTRLRKESQRKKELFKELGKETWKENITVEKSEKISEELKKLEENWSNSLKELDEADAKIEMLANQLKESRHKYEDQIAGKEHELTPYNEKMTETKKREKSLGLDLAKMQRELEAIENNLKAAELEAREAEANPNLFEEENHAKKEESKEKIKNLEKKREKIQKELPILMEEKTKLEKEREKLQARIDDFKKEIKEATEEKKEEIRNFQKEIKEWEKSKEKVRERLREIERQREPLFENLGKIIDELRVDHKKLGIFYSKIDRLGKRIEEIERDIENL